MLPTKHAKTTEWNGNNAEMRCLLSRHLKSLHFQRKSGCSVFLNESWFAQIYQRQASKLRLTAILERSSAESCSALRGRDDGDDSPLGLLLCRQLWPLPLGQYWWRISLPLGLHGNANRIVPIFFHPVGADIVNHTHLFFLSLAPCGAPGFFWIPFYFLLQSFSSLSALHASTA